jgi:hypothetical protein
MLLLKFYSDTILPFILFYKYMINIINIILYYIILYCIMLLSYHIINQAISNQLQCNATNVLQLPTLITRLDILQPATYTYFSTAFIGICINIFAKYFR